MAFYEDDKNVLKEADSTAISAKASDRNDSKSVSKYRDFREMGLSVFDSLTSSLYVKSCEKRGMFAWFLEKLSRPLVFFSSKAKGEKKREKSGLFSDSAFITVSKSFSFLRKHAFSCIGVGLCAILASSVIYNNSKEPTLKLYVNGMYAGTVASYDVVDSAAARAEQRITDITGYCYDLPCTISYSLVSSDKGVSLTEDDIYKLFSEYTSGITRSAYGLYIDNQQVAVVLNRQDVTFAVSTLEAQHLALTGNVAHIANRIDIRYGEYASDKIISRTELCTLLSGIQAENIKSEEKVLLSSSAPVATTEPTTSESVSDISANISESLMSETKNTVSISYESVSYETVREYVDYQTRYIEDDTLFQGQTRISTYGHRGRADITYAVTSIDGEETSRTAEHVSMIYDPVTEVVRVGTRELPENMSPEVNGGKYMIIPLTNYWVSDRFGARILNGKQDYHYGLDLAANYGTSIYAAASGEVIESRFSNSYGYYIKIRHADGKITAYAHCSELLAEVGDTVVQGELIARVGNTGNSFGNHCHFEVIIDGAKVNPELYIYSKD